MAAGAFIVSLGNKSQGIGNMTPNSEPFKPKGPSILGVDPWLPSDPGKGKMYQLLSDEERARLATISTVVRFKKGQQIYRSGDAAHAIFNIIGGVVKASSSADKARIVGFLFPGDLFGLSSEGTYINTVRAVTPVTAYRLALSALRGRLRKDALLEYHVICKLCLELRQSQRHAFLLAQRHAGSKIATFLQMLEQLQYSRSESISEIYIPMDHRDIADYVGMSLSAVSRTFRRLVERGIITRTDRRHAKIADRSAFERMIAQGINSRQASAKRVDCH